MLGSQKAVKVIYFEEAECFQCILLIDKDSYSRFVAFIYNHKMHKIVFYFATVLNIKTKFDSGVCHVGQIAYLVAVCRLHCVQHVAVRLQYFYSEQSVPRRDHATAQGGIAQQI